MASHVVSFLMIVTLLSPSASFPAIPFSLNSPRDASLEWHSSPNDDPGQPLFLTPYIEKGEIQQARELSRVVGVGDHESYSGYMTVNKTYNSNMFFWFFPAQNGDKNAPVLLWLQGGPGASSLLGLFIENGPLYVDKDGTIHDRKVTWNSKYAMIYIDNPVGTGFSFTQSEAGYANNETDVANNLYNCLIQFFELFYDYQKNDFYIAGESYGGKYVPATSFKIHIANMLPDAKLKINMKGILIGDGWTDPVNMVTVYDDLMLQLGLVDENEYNYIQAQMQACGAYIEAGKYLQALKYWDLTIGEYFSNVTGGVDVYNFLRTQSPAEFGYYFQIFKRAEVRKGMHVGNLTYNGGGKVNEHLQNDFMQSVAPELSVVMDNYKVLIYNGQLDVIVGPTLSEAYLQVLSWSGSSQYLKVKKDVWRINPSDTEVAGYARTVGNFTQLIVRGAGHILPYDQPERAFDMVDRFVTGKGFKPFL